MKKKYLIPETEYIDLDLEDVITADMDKNLEQYSNDSRPGATPGVGEDSEESWVEDPWA